MEMKKMDFKKPLAWALGATTPWFLGLAFVIVWLNSGIQ